MVPILTAILIGLSAGAGCAGAPPAPAAKTQRVLTIGRNEDSTTLDPIRSVQNVDIWVLANMFDGLLRVDRTGTKLEPGLAESWTVSDDGLTYRFVLRDARFSDGSPITAADAAFSLLRVRDDPESVWRDSFGVMDDARAADYHTLVVTLKTRSVPFLAMLALPGASVVPQAAVKPMGADAFAEHPVGSGAFRLQEWRKGDRVILEKNPDFWQANRVRLDRVEWVSVPDDNTRVLAVRSGELDAALSVPFSRVAELRQDDDLAVHLDPSTREDHLLINNEHGALSRVEVRQAVDMAIDKQAIVDTVTFGLGEVADSYIPKGTLFHADNPLRPHDPAAAKAMLAQAGASGLTLTYVVNAGNEVDEQVAVLVQQQLAQAGITVVLEKVDPSQTWDRLVAGDYDLSVQYWTNDILDPDQKTTFALGHDSNMNFLTRYRNDTVKDLVAAARIEPDPARREAMYVELQKTAHADVPWIDLYQRPFINVSRKTVDNFDQNPLGRLFLEDTVKN
jgi:peptide/nickel transport system substrate-binding protein